MADNNTLLIVAAVALLLVFTMGGGDKPEKIIIQEQFDDPDSPMLDLGKKKRRSKGVTIIATRWDKPSMI